MPKKTLYYVVETTHKCYVVAADDENEAYHTLQQFKKENPNVDIEEIQYAEEDDNDVEEVKSNFVDSIKELGANQVFIKSNNNGNVRIEYTNDYL